MVKTLRGSQQGTVGGGDAERVQLVFSRRSCGYGASIAVYRRRGGRERQREPECGREAQPVKVCVIETNRSGWMPDRIGDGACRETAPSEGALSRHQSILQPRETLRYRFEVPAGQERWVVVGAEFQQISGDCRSPSKIARAG